VAVEVDLEVVEDLDEVDTVLPEVASEVAFEDEAEVIHRIKGRCDGHL
jgi:hypothetical protein